jgi:outer membrane protein TolC
MLKLAYYELWIAQQSINMTEENARLLRQFTDVAQTKYGVGQVPQQDVLKAYVEIAKLENNLTALRQRELSAKSMLMSLLNRNPNDSLGVATLRDSIVFTPSLQALERLTLQSRPMLLHDSLGVEEGQVMLSLARREFLPDFMLGLQYVTAPSGDFRGWTVIAVISLPFAPW